MNRLLKIVVVLGLLWSGYWYIAGYGLRKGVSAWFDAQEKQGWQADFADIGTSGYPLRHITTLSSPALADPATGTAWQAEWLHLDSPAIWPGRQTVHFPATPQRLSYFDQTVVVQAEGMTADLHLKPGTDLEVTRMALSSGPWQIGNEIGQIAGASALTLSMQDTDAPATYQIDVLAPEFAPGAAVRRLVRGADGLPQRFAQLRLDMTVRFDRAWDLRALEQRRPQPVEIDLKLAQAEWGALGLFAAGRVTLDGNGVPTGDVSIKAENWREMLSMAQASGAIPDYALEPTARVLNLLANISGNPEALDVTLSMRDGMITLGPFPLGPAPRLFLH